jgi:hypothetical protein
MSQPTSGADQSPRGVDARTDSLLPDLAAVEPALWLVVLVTFTLDVYLTYTGIQYGLTEGNPIMAMGFETFGFAVLGLTKAVVMGVAGFYRELRPQHGPVVALGLSLPWLLAVIINALSIPIF